MCAWRLVEPDRTNLVTSVTRILGQLSARGALVDVTGARHVLMVSDYGGIENRCSVSTYSFLVCDYQRSEQGLEALAAVRKRWGHGRPAYSKIRPKDASRLRHLEQFAAAAAGLHGQLFTVAIDKHEWLKHLYKLAPRSANDDPEMRAYVDGLSPEVLRRTLLIVNLGAGLLASGTAPGQTLFWLTDDDEIVANPARLDSFKMYAIGKTLVLLPHGLDGMHVETTSARGKDSVMEDLASVVDLCAGAIADVLSDQALTTQTIADGFVQHIGPPRVPKARAVRRVLGSGPGTLRHTVIRVVPGVGPEEFYCFLVEIDDLPE